MRPSKKEPYEPIWPAVGQKTKLKGLHLAAELEKCRGRIGYVQKRIADEREKGERQTERAVTGTFADQRALVRTLAEVAERDRELAAYQNREKALLAEIWALEHPSAKQRQERAKLQARCASEAMEQWHKDAAIDKILEQLLKALQERAGINARLIETALALGMAATVDLDGARFAALLDSLPADSLAGSRKWLDEFFDQAGAKEAHTIPAGGAVLPETLGDAGVYAAGDCVMLSKERPKLLPPAEPAKPLPGPVEMEAEAGNNMNLEREKPKEDDSFPVSGFRMATSPL
jgi:hypothetical protein